MSPQWAEPRRLWESNTSTTGHENGQARHSNLCDVLSQFVGVGEGSRRLMLLKKLVPYRSHLG